MSLYTYFRISKPAPEKVPQDAVPETYKRLRNSTFWGVTLAYSIFYICRRSDGKICATATANCNPEWPTLHMVGAANEFSGLGLSRSVCAAATNYLIDYGFRRIGLSTDDFRVPAVKTYLHLGFRPWYWQDDMQERWRKLIDDFGYDRADYFAYDALFDRKISI